MWILSKVPDIADMICTCCSQSAIAEYSHRETYACTNSRTTIRLSLFSLGIWRNSLLHYKIWLPCSSRSRSPDFYVLGYFIYIFFMIITGLRLHYISIYIYYMVQFYFILIPYRPFESIIRLTVVFKNILNKKCLE